MLADAGFGLRSFCHFLGAIIQAATACLRSDAGPRSKGTACESASGAQGLALESAGAHVEQPLRAAAAGNEFCQWDEQQATFSLQRATWALADTVTFLQLSWQAEELLRCGSATEAAPVVPAQLVPPHRDSCARQSAYATLALCAPSTEVVQVCGLDDAAEAWPWLRQALADLRHAQRTLLVRALAPERPDANA